MRPHTTSTHGSNTQSSNRVLAVLGVGIALSLLGDQTLYTVLADPRIVSQAGISLAMVGVVLGVNRLTRIFFNIPSGFLYDRSKRRRLMVLSIAFGALSTACYALAPDAVLLLVGRVLWGIAWSGLWIGANTIALDLSSDRINRLAYECEKAAHGTPSGIDNTIATYGTPLLYQRNTTQDSEGGGADARFDSISLAEPIPLVIGITGRESLTANTVARVRYAWETHQARYDGIFDQIAALTRAGVDALRDGHFRELGELMNLCHGYLNALQLSTPELEELVHIARANGALGAKLTGGGGGGSMIALCPDTQDQVAAAMEAAGYKTLQVMPG